MFSNAVMAGFSVALGHAASHSEAARIFPEDTCTLLDWVMISVTSAITVTLISISISLFKLGLRSTKLARLRFGVTVFAAALAGLGVVFGTVSVLRWVECFLLVLGDSFIS